MSKKLVVIPAHNEEDTIREVVTRALRHSDVSVTDDGSRDKTAQIVKSIQAECREGNHANKLNVIVHPQPTHIPKAVQDGLRFAAASQYDFIVTMDAGLSHDPDALPQFFDHNPKVDIVIGRRRNTKNVPLYRRAVSIMARIVVNYALTYSYFDILGPRIEDCTSGYRRYSRKACKLIADTELHSEAFDFHMEALALCYRAGMEAEEIPINYAFSNSSFNKRVLMKAMKFGLNLVVTKHRAIRG